MQTLVFVLSILMSCYLTACENQINTIVPVSAEYLDENLSGKNTGKPIARYGFHRTYECPSFERSFICIRKCLDLNFDVAFADKNCVCTCFKRKDKANYKSPSQGNVTKWRLGAPSTVKPAWAHEHTSEKTHDAFDDENNEAAILNIGSDNENSNDTNIQSDTLLENNENATDHIGTISDIEPDTNSTGGDTAGENGVDNTTEQAGVTAGEDGVDNAAEQAGVTAGENGGDTTPKPDVAEPAETPAT